MYKHLMTATALVGLSLVGSPVGAETQDQKAHQHMRAYLGVRVDTAAPGAEQEEGVTIQEVNRNGPAAKAGLRRGDIIMRVGHRVVEDFADLTNAITRHHPGDRVNIQVRRDGQEKTFPVTLNEQAARRMPRADEGQEQFGRQEVQDRYGRRPGESTDQDRVLQRLTRRLQRLEDRLDQQADFSRGQEGRYGSLRQTAFLGVQTRPWAQAASRRRGGTMEEGAQITEVDPDSPATEAGLRPGDVITAINGRDVTTPQELRQALQQAGSRQEIVLEVQRGDRQREVRVYLDGRAEGAEETRALQRLARRIEQLEDRIQEQADFNRDRQDRYGRWQGSGADQSRDVQEMQRRLQQLDSRLRELEQNQQTRRQRD
jgi:predicted metalloprotease with PDZ domain